MNNNQTTAKFIANIHGKNLQTDQFVEEASELMKELIKFKRYSNNLPNIEEEIGDVLNVIDTLIEAFNLDRERLNVTRIAKMKKYASSL